jgi:hypothetical protein
VMLKGICGDRRHSLASGVMAGVTPGANWIGQLMRLDTLANLLPANELLGDGGLGLNHGRAVLTHNGSGAAGVIEGTLVVEVVGASVVVAAVGTLVGVGVVESARAGAAARAAGSNPKDAKSTAAPCGAFVVAGGGVHVAPGIGRAADVVLGFINNVFAIVDIVLNVLTEVDVVAHGATAIATATAGRNRVAIGRNDGSSKGCGESQSVNELAFHGVFSFEV